MRSVRPMGPSERHASVARRDALLVCACACVVALGFCGDARALGDDVYEDEVTRKPGDPLIGVKIKEDSWKFVVAGMQRGEIPVPAYQVVDIVYADMTRAFASGIKRAARGFYSNAIKNSFLPTMEKLDRFRKVDGKPWPLQYCLYYLGHCHLMRGKPGDSEKAREYFERLVKEVPGSRFIFKAVLGLAQTYQVEQKFEEAGEAYKDAKKRFDNMARDPAISQEHAEQVRYHALLAELRSIQMLDALEKHDLSGSAYRRLISRARDYPKIKAKALVGVVRALVSTQQYDRAIQECGEMVDAAEREGNMEYLGGAYLALADCYFERAGDKESTPEDLVIARWNYLRVATLYFFETKLLPKARFRAGRCFERLAEHKGENPKRAREQARRQYELVVSESPESPWAAEAQKSLRVLGDAG